MTAVVPPKPSVWQGPTRLTRDQWWAKSNAMNTAVILCQTKYIAFVDDRCVLAPTWLNAVKRAMANQYAVCGTYEKRSGMKVENGVIVEQGELLGVDNRGDQFRAVDSFHGGSCALPLEWCLEVNGWPEDICDGIGNEDDVMGGVLREAGHPTFFDPEMKIIEDRTPTELDGALKRADKNPHLGRQAKSHAVIRIMRGKTSSQNSYCIRNMRDRILLNHEEFPPPSAAPFDWYDNQPLSEME